MTNWLTDWLTNNIKIYRSASQTIKNAKLPLPKSSLFDVVSEVNLFMVMKNTCYSWVTTPRHPQLSAEQLGWASLLWCLIVCWSWSKGKSTQWRHRRRDCAVLQSRGWWSAQLLAAWWQVMEPRSGSIINCYDDTIIICSCVAAPSASPPEAPLYCTLLTQSPRRCLSTRDDRQQHSSLAPGGGWSFLCWLRCDAS